jgi:hypothetical protein
MLLTAAWLVIYSVCAILIGLMEDSLPMQAAGAVAVLATYGVAMVRPWSRYLVYMLTIAFFAKLGLSIYDGIVSGYFEFQFDSSGAIARSLLPTFAMALLASISCAIVYRQFRPEPNGSA